MSNHPLSLGSPSGEQDIRSSARPWGSSGEDLVLPREILGILHSALRDESLRAPAASARPGSRRDWENCMARLEALPQETTRGQLQGLLRQIPPGGSAHFRELISILQERDLEFVGDAFVVLAQRYLSRPTPPPVVDQLLSFAEAHGSSRNRARELRVLLRGGGGFFAQAEFQAPHLVRELTSPIALGSFGLAGLAARGASLGVLARAARPTWGTLLAAESAALAVEVPTLVISRRAAETLIHGGQGMFAADAVWDEMRRMWLPFAFLRASSNGLRTLGPRLAQAKSFNGGGNALNFPGRALMSSGGFAAEVLSVAAGHTANVHLGLERPAYPEAGIWTQSLLTVAHQRIAGHLIERSGLFRLSPQLEALRRDLRENRPPENGIIESLGFSRPSYAFSGAVPARPGPRGAGERPLPVPAPMMSENGNGGESGGGGEGRRKTPSNPPKGPTRSRFAVELLDQKLAQYESGLNEENSVLRRVVHGFREALDRIGEQPDPENDEILAQRISELEIELERLKESRSGISLLVDSIRLFLDRSADPKEAEKHKEDFQKENEQRSAIAQSFRRGLGLLRNIRDRGQTPERSKRLLETLQSINSSFQTTLFNLPGVKQIRDYRNQQTQLADRRLGAIFGLAFRPDRADHDSPVAREMRGGEALVPRPDDLELEYLHRALLVFAHQKPKGKDLPAALQGLAGEYRASPQSAAALQLFGETLHWLANQNHPPEEIPGLIHRHRQGEELEEQLLVIDSLRDMGGEPGEGLDMIAVEPNAADYFSSGLLAMLRTGGDGEQLRQWVASARQQGVPGFHPSIAISLFGAAHGRSRIPADLLIEEKRLEEWIKRVEED